MRRIFGPVLALSIMAGFTSASAQAPQPPHAWLFGTWSGGLFPVPTGLTPEACLSQPVVIFTRDVVLRATLVDQLYIQRLIATARATSTGFEFSFASSQPNSAAGTMLGLPSEPAATGFSCDTNNVLHVQRRGENEISFPGCREFPNPLVRCQAR